MRFRPLLAALAFAVASCGGDSSGPATTLDGKYHLQTADGEPLPFVDFIVDVEQDIYLDLVENEITFYEDGEFIDVLFYDGTFNGEAVDDLPASFPGTYTRSGNSVIITYDSDGSSHEATLNGDVLTIDYGGSAWVYQK